MLELVKDYDCVINYHPGKANVVADALNRKTIGNLSILQGTSISLRNKIQKFDLELVLKREIGHFATLTIKPTILERIKIAQSNDLMITKLKDECNQENVLSQ